MSDPKKSFMLCRACADTDEVLSKAYDKAAVATADPQMRCAVCDLGIRSTLFPEQHRGYIMDCMLTEQDILRAMQRRFSIRYDTMDDKEGKCGFTLFWTVDYHPGHPEGENKRRERGQCFRADPTKYGFPKPALLSLGYVWEWRKGRLEKRRRALIAA